LFENFGDVGGGRVEEDSGEGRDGERGGEEEGEGVSKGVWLPFVLAMFEGGEGCFDFSGNEGKCFIEKRKGCFFWK